MFAALAFSMVACPAACFGIRASAERVCRKWWPDSSPEDRTEMIRLPSRAFVRALSVLAFAYVSAWRALGRPSLMMEFVYVGAVAAAEVFYAWEDAVQKPQLERLGVAFSVYVVALYLWNDDFVLCFATGYTFFGTIWALLNDAEILELGDVSKAHGVVRGLEIACLSWVLCRPAYDSGAVSPFMILLDLLIVRGSRAPWYI